MLAPWQTATDAFLDSYRTVRSLRDYFDARYNAPTYASDSAFIAAGVRDRIYLRARTDSPVAIATNVAGDGTLNNPFDVSSAVKLAAVWAYLAARTFTVRVFLSGTIITAASLPLPQGCGVEGLGVNRTTIQLAANSLAAINSRIDIFASVSDYATSGNSVRDLTIDGNRSNQPSFNSSLDNCQLYAINLLGSSAFISDVDVINTFNTGSGEAFPVIYATGNGSYVEPGRFSFARVRVLDHRGFATAINALGVSYYDTAKSATGSNTTDIITCASHGYAAGDTIYFLSKIGGSALFLLRPYYIIPVDSNSFQLSNVPYGSALNLGSDISAATIYKQAWVAGRFQDCVVTSSLSVTPKVQGIGCGGFRNVLIDGCEFLDLFSGVFTDTHNYERVTVKDCTFRVRPDISANAGSAIFAGGGFRWSDWTIKDNIFWLYANTIGVRFGSSTGNNQNAVIDSNRFYSTADATGSSFPTAAAPLSLTLTNNTGARVTNNSFSLDGLDFTGCGALGTELSFATNNRYTDGTATPVPDSLFTVLSSGYSKPLQTGRIDGGSNAAQTIGSASRATFNGTNVRTGTLYSTSTDRITAPSAGKIEIKAQITLSSVTAAGFVQLEVLKNGASNVLPFAQRPLPVALDTLSIFIEDDCAASDYYEVSIFNSTGASLDVSRNFQLSSVSYRFTSTN